ncbi:MAG: glycoside hydrolase family 2 protein [Actinomycetota bacterium]
MLHAGWQVSAMPGQDCVPADLRARSFPATVPGCVHTDLLAAGAIPDPYLDANELEVAWVGRAGWRYAMTFSWSPDGQDRQELVFEGLDTVAHVQLNGVLLGSSANMHRSFRYDVGSLLRDGDNELVVTFESAWDYGEAMRDALGDLPNAYPNPFNFIRKMACSFGWDWGLSTVTAGIWRPVSLHSWSGARLDRLRPHVTVVGSGTGSPQGRVVLAADVVPVSEHVLAARISGQGIEVAATAAAGESAITLDVPNVQLWWPHSLGGQPLYTLTVELTDPAGLLLDSWTRRVGFRDVRWDTDLDEAGRAFTLVVNERPVFVRGVNWIPDDAFPARIDKDRYADRLGQARAANVDLIRVWGGGIYESDDFYDRADELGLMVWQDFLFACAAYPQEEPFAAEVEAEARENVTRLMPHPSLVLWNGNNENIWGWFDWGWLERVGDRSWGKGYYLDLLPRVVREIDPTRTYWPGSPYSGSFEIPPNDPAHGPMHIWDVWNERDYSAYRDYLPRFVSEFGYQAPPAWATLTRAVHDEVLAADSPGVLHHQKAQDGNGKLARGLAAHFPDPVSVDDWHFLTQVNQARALTLGIEHFRSHRGRCMGTVWWQLNDCWPVTSWAVIDGDARPKPSYFALRRAYADRLLTIQPRPAGPAVILVNDTSVEWVCAIRVERLDMRGRTLAQESHNVLCAAFSTVEKPLGDDIVTPTMPEAEFVVAEASGLRTTWWFVEDRDLRLDPPTLEVSVVRSGAGYEVGVRSPVVVRDLCLFADRLDPGAGTDDALLTLLPGETARFRVESVAVLDESAFAGPPVLRCINDVVASL